MKYRFLFSFLLFTLATLAQPNFSKWQKMLKTTSHKAPVYNQMASSFKGTDFQLAKPFIDSALIFSKKEQNDTALAIAQSLLAHYYLTKQNIKQTYSILRTCIPRLKMLKDKTPLLDAYSDLGTSHFYQNNYDSAIFYFKKPLSQTSLNDSIASISLNNIAVAYYYMEQYDSSIAYNKKSLAIKKRFHNDKGVAYSLNNIAGIYDIQGEYDTSSKYYYQALDYCDKTHAIKLKSTVLNNIAGLYKLWNEYDKALELYNEALALKKELNDSLGEANVKSNIGTIYLLKKNYSLAEQYHKQAKTIYSKLNYKRGLSISYNNLGVVYEKKGDLYNAVLYYKLSKKIITSPRAKANANLNIGRTYLLMKRNDTAEHYLVKSLDIVRQHNFLDILQKIYFNLANLYEQEENIGLAYSYLKLYYTLKDSMASTERYKQVTELESKYKTKQQQQEIKNLSQQQKIAAQKLEIQDLRFKRIRWVITFLIISILGGIALFSLWYRQKTLKAQHRSIELEQKLLRLQMNPHFISNALTSIQQFVLSNNPMEAARYLAKFSNMMRNIIESSREAFIPLAKEQETIEHYLTLQHLRFSDIFDYHIHIDENLDADNTLVPPMLAQPIIENAIHHAFAGINYKGIIDISFTLTSDNKLEFTIIDNGIGFTEGTKEQDNTHTSYSLEIIKDRIANLKKTYKGNYLFEIKNRQDFDKKSGTFVRFILPLKSI